ncbi:MAG: hypothetical protein R2758_15855 [Bacteroidales bacterium]
MEVASQIFREDFRQLSADDRSKIGDYGVMAEYAARVFSIRNGFESELRRLAEEGVTIYTGCGLTPDDFLSKRRGNWEESLRRYATGDTRKPNSAWIKAAEEGKYFAGSAPPAVAGAFGEAMGKGLDDVVKSSISELFEKRYGLCYRGTGAPFT